MPGFIDGHKHVNNSDVAQMRSLPEFFTPKCSITKHARNSNQSAGLAHREHREHRTELSADAVLSDLHSRIA